MNAIVPSRPSPPTPSVRPASLALLAAPTALLGAISLIPDGAGLAIVAIGVALAVALRISGAPSVSAYAPVPALFALVLVVMFAPVTFAAELLAGFGGLALLVWLADDPARPAGSAVRSLSVVAVPALAVGIAWSSALFLPAGVVPFGVAGGLLALTLAALAFLFATPAVFDREGARS